MSIPSSRLAVATMAGISPAFSRSSISRRRSLATEPWCTWTSSYPASSFTSAAIRSAARRLLTNTIVARWARMSSCSRA